MDCLFCKMVEKKIDTRIVYEDDVVLGILDIHPRAPGHTVMIPKFHAETILELPPEYDAGVMKAVRAMTAQLQKALHPQGFTIGINHGKPAGQLIDHLHIHIIPRWEGDNGGSIHSVVSNEGSLSLEAIQEKIKSVQ